MGSGRAATRAAAGGPVVVAPPRTVCWRSAGTTPSATAGTLAMHPSTPAATRAALWPSPRCSRSRVHAHHSRMVKRRRRDHPGVGGVEGPADHGPLVGRGRFLHQRHRVASSGVGTQQTGRARPRRRRRGRPWRPTATPAATPTGITLLTSTGEKLKNVAWTTLAPTGPQRAAPGGAK